MELQRSNDGPMRLLIPAYFPPGAEWGVMRAAAGAVGMVILNPASGPGEGASDAYRTVADALRGAGIEVMGYVDTSYGARGAAVVLSEVEQHRLWYDVDGVFFDQVSADTSLVVHHRRLADDARALGCRRVVMNTGVVPPAGPAVAELMDAADVIVLADNDAGAYLDMPVVTDWTRHYPPARFAHLVYGAPDIASMTAVVATARAHGVGWVFATPLPVARLRSGAVAPHPWAGLPGADYWAKLLAAVAGNVPPGA